MFSSFQLLAIIEAASVLIEAGKADRALWLLNVALKEGDGRRTITGIKRHLHDAGIDVIPELNTGKFHVRK